MHSYQHPVMYSFVRFRVRRAMMRLDLPCSTVRALVDNVDSNFKRGRIPSVNLNETSSQKSIRGLSYSHYQSGKIPCGVNGGLNVPNL